MNFSIPPMRIGAPTCAIGLTVIAGSTIAGNALLMFQASQALSADATLTDAYRLARTQAFGLRQLPALTDRQSKMLGEVHEWICCGVEEVPADLTRVYQDFQKDPSITGISLYFNLLADLIRQTL